MIYGHRPFTASDCRTAMDRVAESASRGFTIPAGVAEDTGYTNGTVCVLFRMICEQLGEVVRG